MLGKFAAILRSSILQVKQTDLQVGRRASRDVKPCMSNYFGVMWPLPRITGGIDMKTMPSGALERY
jgi:hypothetical protein